MLQRAKTADTISNKCFSVTDAPLLPAICMIPAVEPARTGDPKSNQVDVSEVFSSAFMFAAATPRGLDAKVGHYQKSIQVTSTVFC